MDFELVHSYTQAHAIADGVLVDVTATAKQTGFAYPVALTRAVFDRYVTVPEGVECQGNRSRSEGDKHTDGRGNGRPSGS
jgi:hypothetical protein